MENKTTVDATEISKEIDPSIESKVESEENNTSEAVRIEVLENKYLAVEEVEMDEKDIQDLQTILKVIEVFSKTDATSIVRNILNKQYPFSQANAEKVLVGLIDAGLIVNVRD